VLNRHSNECLTISGQDQLRNSDNYPGFYPLFFSALWPWQDWQRTAVVRLTEKTDKSLALWRFGQL
jgi:hypothetical protein